MKTASRTKRKRRECFAPDCNATAMDGKNFCRVCQAVLDRVRKELEAGPVAGRRVNGTTVLPTVQSVDEARAASFDAGLKRRAESNKPITEAGLLTRAVRIIQLRNDGKTDKQIIEHLCLRDQAELDEDLSRYRQKIQSNTSRRVNGLQRDVELDQAIVNRLKSHAGTRRELAVELGISYSALVSRITRLRRDGYEIPDARKHTKVAVAA